MSADEFTSQDNAPSSNPQQRFALQQMAMQQAYFAQLQQQQLLAQAMSLNQAFTYGNMLPSQYQPMMAATNVAATNPMAHLFNSQPPSFDPANIPFPHVAAHNLAPGNPLLTAQSPAYPLPSFPHQLPSDALAGLSAPVTTAAYTHAEPYREEDDRRNRERLKCRQRRVRKRQQWSDLLASNQLLTASIAQHIRSRNTLDDQLTELRSAVLSRRKTLYSLIASRKTASDGSKTTSSSPEASLAATPTSSPTLSPRETTDFDHVRSELVPPLSAS
jgi:hypothetical protein